MKVFSRERPWYVAGLAFECAACGRCCAGPEEGYVWVTDREIAAITRHLGISEPQMRKRHLRKVGRRFSLLEKAGSNDCIFLSDGHCRVYSVRPSQCRTWPFWQRNLDDPDSWAMAGMRCRGINCGRIHDLDEIEQKRRATRE